MNAIKAADIKLHYDILSKIGCLGNSPEHGYLRAAYSEEETFAIKYFEEICRPYGFTPRWDKFRNLFIEKKGKSSKFLEVGSHVDTVPSGGNFDGLAGIVAGFEALKSLSVSDTFDDYGLRLRIWRGEESGTFGSAYIGSSAAFGILNPSKLSLSFKGKSLKEAMVSQQAEVSAIENSSPSITKDEADNIALHLEVHIEQGNLLQNENLQIGIVTGIRGPSRFRVKLTGSFNHSGTTPMGVRYRRDCNLTMAHIIVELNSLAEKHISEGNDLVQTFGLINANQEGSEFIHLIQQNGISKVSGFACFYIDVRSTDNKFKESYCQEVQITIKQICSRFNTEFSIEKTDEAPALESINSDVISLIEKSCLDLGLSYTKMPSGAGHDCAVVGKQKQSNAKNIPTGLIFIPCRDGISHSPLEYCSYEAIADGANLIKEIFRQFSN